MKKIIFRFVFLILTTLSKNIIVQAGEQFFFDRQNQRNSNQCNISLLTAFNNLHAALTEEYTLTDWKQIDWPAVYAKFRPRINAAEEANDTTAYFLALREYVYSIPDGHKDVELNFVVETLDQFIMIEDDQVTKYLQIQLDQNYPNPFNLSTKIKFTLPKSDEISIDIYNTIGEKLATLLNKTMPAGNHEIEFNAQDLSSGLYVY